MLTNLDLSAFSRYSTTRNRTTVGLTNTTYGLDASCNCLTNPSCLQPVMLSAWNSDVTGTVVVPGLYLGCYTLEAILHSSLRCFYLRPCINVMISYVSTTERVNINPQPLDTALDRSYTINSTIGEMFDHLMVDTWSETISVRAHFEACQPLTCTYSFVTRHDLIYILTALLGIIGGLNRVLRLIVPFIVRMAYKLFERRRNRVEVITTQ